MHQIRFSPSSPRPLEGPGLHFSLLLPLFVLLFVGPLPGPRFHGDRPVRLSGIHGPEFRTDADADIVVAVQADGYAFIGPKWYPADALLAGINSRLASSPASRVLIRADKSAPFGSVRTVLRALQQARVPSVLLVTYEAYADEPGAPLPLFFRDAT